MTVAVVPTCVDAATAAAEYSAATPASCFGIDCSGRRSVVAA